MQYQFSWSFGNNVSLLAAGSSNPQVGSSGSGIYEGSKGAKIAITALKEGQRTLLTAKLPIRKRSLQKISKRSIREAPQSGDYHVSTDDIFLKRDYLQNYNSILLNTSFGFINEDLCYNSTFDDINFCCHFDIGWKHLSNAENSYYYKYRYGVLANVRNEVSVEKNIVFNCAVFACVGDEIEDCGKIYSAEEIENLDPQISFEHIIISAKFPEAKQYVVMPNSLKENMMPFSVNEFIWKLTDAE